MAHEYVPTSNRILKANKTRPVVFSSLNSFNDLRSLMAPHANVNGASEPPETDEMEDVACSALLLLVAATLFESPVPPPADTALTPRSSTILRSECRGDSATLAERRLLPPPAHASLAAVVQFADLQMHHIRVYTYE